MAYSKSSKFAAKFCAKTPSPLNQGIGNIHAQKKELENLEPLIGTKKNIGGKVDYQMGFENDEAVAKERKHVEGTEHEADFDAYHKRRKEQLRNVKNLERIEDIENEQDD